MTTPKKNYDFEIKGIKVDDVHNKYKVFEHIEPKDNKSITRIEDLEEKTITFLDESRCLRSCDVSYVDCNNKTINKGYHCFWCKHPFTSRPIGCPVKHESVKKTIKYTSEVNQIQYTIEETALKSKQNDNDTSFYTVDGVFCSFNCCSAYIEDNKHDSLYENSENLLFRLYWELTSKKTLSLPKAPHWRTINVFGGHLSIEQYRKSFDKSEYTSVCQVKPSVVSFIPMLTLTEHKLKF